MTSTPDTSPAFYATPDVADTIDTREGWLLAAAALIARQIEQATGAPMPAYRIATGFTSAGLRSSTIGECWSKEVTEDGACEVFISARLTDKVQILATLAHELVHVAMGHAEGHGKGFRKVALAIGLRGKMTATVAGVNFAAIAGWLVDEVLPTMPGAKAAFQGGAPIVGGFRMGPGGGGRSGPKTQGTRMRKCFCPECDYTVRTTAKWLAVATPKCPVHDCDMEVQ